MSLRRWLETLSSGYSYFFAPRRPWDQPALAANKQIVKAMDEKSKWKRRRGEYNHYSGQLRAKVAKYACEFGNKAAVQKYSAELGFTLSEGTVRNFKRTYLERLKSTPDPDAITSLFSSSLGRLLLLGRYDDDVYDYIKCFRRSGGVVNSTIVIFAAKGIKTLVF